MCALFGELSGWVELWVMMDVLILEIRSIFNILHRCFLAVGHVVAFLVLSLIGWLERGGQLKPVALKTWITRLKKMDHLFV
jgi:hypothetical protein